MASEKPYSRYEIKAELKDKGVGYEIKKAITTFLDLHSLTGKVLISDITSTVFNATLELYDSGKNDFNIQHLSNHLETSGRMPIIPSNKPKITIKPISCDYSLSAVQKTQENVAWEKTIQELNEKISKKEDSISDLARTLTERQKTINEQSSHIKTLEQRLSSDSPKKNINAIDALIDSYIISESENIYEVSSDYMSLSNINKKALETLNNKPLNFISYLNYRTGLNFGSESEYNDWKNSMLENLSWEETPSGKTTLSELAPLEADKKLLETAEALNASKEVIDALKKRVKEEKSLRDSLNSNIQRQKENFKKGSEAYSHLGEIQKDFSSFSKVYSNSLERKKKNSEISVLVHTKKGHTKMYLPSIDNECEFEKHIYELIKKHLPEHEKRKNNGYIEIILKKQIKPSNISGLSNEIKNSKIMQLLGISGKTLFLSED